MQKYCVEITEFETGIREVPDEDGDYYRVADVDARIAELRGVLQEIRVRLHVAGRRPEECYEMSLIDSALMER